MTTKEKYELIDKTKINEKILTILRNMEQSSSNFTDEAVNSKIDGALEKLIEQIRANKPEALRTLPEAKKEVKKEKEKAIKKNEGKDFSDKKDTDDKTGLPKKDTLEERKDIIKEESETEKEARDRAKKELEKEKEKAKDEIESQIEKLNRLILEDPALRGFNTGSAATGGGRSTPIIDAERKALPRGSRVSQKGWENQYGASKGGRKYWENRENRSDRKSPEYETGKPYLEKGGNIDSVDERMNFVIAYNYAKDRGIDSDRSFEEFKEEFRRKTPKSAKFSNKVMLATFSALQQKYAKGGNVYSSDEMYLIAMFKGDVDLDTISIRAKNKAEARMIFEDTYREKYEDKLGDFAIEIYVVKPFPESDSYAQGGVIKAKNISDWDWGKIFEKVNLGLGESFVTILPKNSDGGKIKYGLIIRDASNQFDRSSNISYIFDLDDKYYPNDRQAVKDTISSPYYDKDKYKEIARGSHLLVITIQGNRKTLLKDLIDKVNYTFFSKINRRNEMDLPMSYPNKFLYDLLVFEGSISDLVDFVKKLQSAFQYEGAKLYTEPTPYIMSIIWNIPESTDYRNSVITPATYIPIFELANEVEAKTSKKRKYADGGEVEGVDLFEDYDDQPEEVQAILANYEMEDNDYETLQNLKAELESIGYTMEFGLDAEPYDLRKIGEKGKSEFYAKGGQMADGGGIPYKPYGKTKGRFKLTYEVEGEEQSEIRESLEEATDSARRYVNPKLGYTNVHIYDESGKEYFFADGGETDDDDTEDERLSMGESVYFEVFNDDGKDGIIVFRNDGSNIIEALISGDIKRFRPKRYMSYLTKKDLQRWLNRDFNYVEEVDEEYVQNILLQEEKNKPSDIMVVKYPYPEVANTPDTLTIIKDGERVFEYEPITEDFTVVSRGLTYPDQIELRDFLEDSTSVSPTQYTPELINIIEVIQANEDINEIVNELKSKGLIKNYIDLEKGREMADGGEVEPKIYEINNGYHLYYFYGDNKAQVLKYFKMVYHTNKYEQNISIRIMTGSRLKHLEESEEYDYIEDARVVDNINEGDEMAHGGGIPYKPYGKTKGRFKLTYEVEGEEQSEIRESLEEATDSARRYVNPKLGYTNVHIYDESGKEYFFADGGEIENRRTLKFSDTVLYKDEMYEFVKKDGEVGFVSHSQGAWGMNGRFLPLGRMYRSDLEENLTDMYGNKFYIPNYEDLMEMPYGFAKGGMMADGGKLDEEISKIKSLGGDWQSYYKGVMAGKKDDGYVTIENEADLTDYIYDKTGYIVKNIEVIEKGKNYPYNDSNPYSEDTYLVTLKNGSNFSFERSYGRPNWQGNVNYIERIKITNINTKQNKGGMMADGGGVGEIKITKNEVQINEDEPHRVYHWYEGTLGRYVFYAQTDNSSKTGYGSYSINKGSIYKLSIRKVKENGMHESIAEYWNKWDYRTKNLKDGAIRGKIIKYLDSISDERHGLHNKYDVVYNSYDQETGDMIADNESVYVIANSISEAKNKAMTMLEEGSSDEEFTIVRANSMMADGGEVSKGYKKFGEDNSQLVNFDLSELDDYEEMQFNHALKSFSKAESLQVLINTVEGDYSQLDERLAEIAEEQYPSEEFFENTRDYANGGEVKKDWYDIRSYSIGEYGEDEAKNMADEYIDQHIKYYKGEVKKDDLKIRQSPFGGQDFKGEYVVMKLLPKFAKGGEMPDGYMDDETLLHEFKETLIDTDDLQRSIKEYYVNAFPTDDEGFKIEPDANFAGLNMALTEGDDVYKYLGVTDSLVRERVFEKLSEILGVDYDLVYNMWLRSNNYAKGGQMADGGELNGNLYRVGYLKVYENDEEGDTVYTKEIYGDSEEDVSSKFKKIHPKHKIEFISKYADGGMMADGGETTKSGKVKNLEDAKKWVSDRIKYDKVYPHKKNVYYFLRSSMKNPKFPAVVATYFNDQKIDENIFIEQGYAKGGMMADGGEVDFSDKMAKMRSAYENLNMIVKSRIAVAVGIDRAISIMENDYSIDPFGLITSAVRGGLLELDEINKDLVNEAVYEAERVTDDYRDSGQGISGSDMTYFTKSVLDGVGYKTGFVNNRLTRVDADGNELVIDKYEMNY